METKIFFEVKPEHFGFASVYFDNKDEAVKYANERNKVRAAKEQYNKNYTTIYFGDKCKIFEVVEIKNEIKF